MRKIIKEWLSDKSWAQVALEVFIITGGFLVLLSYIWLFAICSGKV